MIEIGKYAGFCPGVARAVNAALSLASKPEHGTVYTLGMLIHNRTVVSELEELGVHAISEEDIPKIYQKAQAGEKQTVILRAHGVVNSLSERLFKMAESCPDFAVVDCTCKYVKRIHEIVSSNTDEETALAVFGAPEHPEVKGICSYARGNVTVLPDVASAEALKGGEKPTILVSQTTQKLSEWKKCQKIFKKLYTNSKIYDTICSVTEHRQAEVVEMAKRNDLMIVIGSKESSNTMKLYEEASRYCKTAWLIEDAAGLPKKSPQVTNIGITAGASTPSRIIEEVHKIMSEILENENFEELLNASFKTLNTGDTVTGYVTSVSATELTVDVGSKVTGIVPYDEVAEDNSVDLTKVYKIGDRITARATRVSDVEGVAVLSIKQAERGVNFKKLAEAYEANEVLTGRVTDVVKGGVIVSAKYNRVFIPAGQTGIPKEGDLGELKGKTVKFKIIDMDVEKNRVVGSIRVVEREERKAQLEEFWANIEEGKVYTGVVKNIQSFGAFVDLGGIDGMVHTTELSWQKIKSPEEVVKVGDVLEVYVKSFDREKKRISLGYKKAEDDPWVLFTAKYNEGDVAPVKIVSFMPFGAFAEVLPGADGLIHISQIADKRVNKPSDELEIGQVVDAKIVGIDYENKKISLSIRALVAPESIKTEEAFEEVAEEATDAE